MTHFRHISGHVGSGRKPAHSTAALAQIQSARLQQAGYAGVALIPPRVHGGSGRAGLAPGIHRQAFGFTALLRYIKDARDNRDARRDNTSSGPIHDAAMNGLFTVP